MTRRCCGWTGRVAGVLLAGRDGGDEHVRPGQQAQDDQRGGRDGERGQRAGAQPGRDAADGRAAQAGDAVAGVQRGHDRPAVPQLQPGAAGVHRHVEQPGQRAEDGQRHHQPGQVPGQPERGRARPGTARRPPAAPGPRRTGPRSARSAPASARCPRARRTAPGRGRRRSGAATA